MWFYDYTLGNVSWNEFDQVYVSPLYDTFILTASLLFWLTVSHLVLKLVATLNPNYSTQVQHFVVHHVTKCIFATILTPYVIQCIWENWHIFNDPFNPGEFDQKAMDIILFSTGYSMHLWFKERHFYLELESDLFKMDCEYFVLFMVVHMYSHKFTRLYIIYSLSLIHDFVDSLDSLMHCLPNQTNVVMRIMMSLDYATFLVFRVFLLWYLGLCFMFENVTHGMSYYNYISILHILNAMENRNLVYWVLLFRVDANNESFCALGMFMISYWQHKYHPELVILKLVCFMLFGPQTWNRVRYRMMFYLPDTIRTLFMNPFQNWP